MIQYGKGSDFEFVRDTDSNLSFMINEITPYLEIWTIDNPVKLTKTNVAKIIKHLQSWVDNDTMEIK